MQDLQQASFTDLIDMLSAHTAIYMTMLRNRATRDEFEKCRDEIKQIQWEIEKRKIRQNEFNAGSSDISFTQNLSL